MLSVTTAYAVDLEEERKAHARIGLHAHRTPVLTCSTLDRLSGRELLFKCDNFQKAGAFKFRGACNAVLRLPADLASRGVVTHSSGNHAQALALAASIRGVEAHVVMPKNASKVKRRATEGYGARIYPCEPNLSARETLAAQGIERTGATLIPPYDHPDIIAGQGTLALELMEQVQSLDAIIAPVGGGGLISGVSIAAKGLDPKKTYQLGFSWWDFDNNGRKESVSLDTGEGTPMKVFTDEQIVAAMRLVWERMKIIIEPSAAVAVAAVVSDEFVALEGILRVAVVLSGGNVDLDRPSW